DRWTQDDYYDWTDLFARVNYKVIENRREISSDEHEWNGEQIIFMAREGSVKNPRTGKEAQPRFLGEGNSRAPQLTRGPSREGATTYPPEAHFTGDKAGGPAPDELDALADWLTSPANAWFARVQANRIWYHLMGRGLVDPPDDFRATNPASHPALLDALADDFARH